MPNGLYNVRLQTYGGVIYDDTVQVSVNSAFVKEFSSNWLELSGRLGQMLCWRATAAAGRTAAAHMMKRVELRRERSTLRGEYKRMQFMPRFCGLNNILELTVKASFVTRVGQ